MNKLRVSYSLLKMWQEDKEQAVANYLHLPREKTPQMQHGIDRHKLWQDVIGTEGEITLGKTTYTFEDPFIEKEIIHDYNDLFLVKGYIDVLDGKTIYEFKTGVVSASQYSNSMQIPFYFMLCQMSGIEIDKAIIIREHEDVFDSAIVWNWQDIADEARNWVDSIAPEIYHYFTENNIPL